MLTADGLLKKLKWILWINGFLTLVLTEDLFGVGSELPKLTALSIGVTAISILVYILGQTFVFPLFCKLPLVWRIFPNVDGKYEVEVSSNWSLVEAHYEGRQPGELGQELFTKIGSARIVARLTQLDFHVSMKDGYSKSETIMCSLHRGKGSNQHKLLYIFDATIRVPKLTDAGKHLGAGELDIPQERRPRILEGQYWTNRNWRKGLNTAGSIRLRRLPR